MPSLAIAAERFGVATLLRSAAVRDGRVNHRQRIYRCGCPEPLPPYRQAFLGDRERARYSLMVRPVFAAR
jgi:hypothetical protein